MKMQAARVLEELNRRLLFAFDLYQDLPGSFRVASENTNLVVQFNFLPRSPAEEMPPDTWRKQQAMFSKRGKSLVHIWEDQWVFQREITLSRLAAIAGTHPAVPGLKTAIHGRETSVRRVDSHTAYQFLADNHLLTPLKGKYRFGLFHRNQLVSLAVFSGGRQMKSNASAYRSFELVRFCHLRMHLVRGGLSKLLTAFRLAFFPDHIMTYVDLDWSEGHAFRKLDFIPSGERAPQVFWIHPDEMHRYYPSRLPVGLANALPEQLHQAGYFRIANCGSLKLIKLYH